jgi:Family of unknown function (DUF5309)
MTVPTNTEQTYGFTNIREDLSDLVYNVDPFKTPIFNTAKKEEAKQTYHEWDMDALAAQNTANQAIEGDNPLNIAITATARVGNRTQISTKTIQLSGTTQSVIAAGGTNKMGYQLAKKSKELKRDIEGTITANNASAAGSATVARVSAGLPSWLQNNIVYNSGGSPAGANPTGVATIGTSTFGNGTTTRTYSGTKQAVVEADVKSVLQKVYTASGDCPEYCFLSPTNKQNVSAFTGPGTRFIEVEDKTLMTAVDVYQSDFGDVKMIPDIFLATSGDMYFINPNYLKVAYLRPFQIIPLAKTGDSDQKMMLAEYTLVMANEHAHGARFDTTG